jgi:putative protease
LAKQLAAESSYDMEMAFSRGLYTGWLRGVNNQALVHARFGKKRGVFLGEVARLQKPWVVLRLESALKPGDGIVFDAGHPDQQEEGGRVYEMRKQGAETWLSFGGGDLDFRRIQAGDRVWKTNDPELDRRLRSSFSGSQVRFLRPVFLEVFGKSGEVLTVSARDELGHEIRASSSVPLIAAEKQPLDSVRLREHLGRLGGTPFRLAALKNHLEGAVILPVSELNRLRREWVGQLQAQRTVPKRWLLREPTPEGPSPFLAINPAPAISGTENVFDARGVRDPEFIVLVRSLAQLEAALQADIKTIYCELEDPKRYSAAVRLARESANGKQPGPTLWVVPPRITKPGEDWILKQVRASNADGYVVRNYDQLHFFADARRVGDFSLNIANPLSAEHFIRRFGLERVTASYDLSVDQLEALLRAAPPAWFEVTIHQPMPMFHMEHCVFCAFLSQGKDYHDCGRPCEKHDVKLRDRVGIEHPIKADAGCRNTVYNGRSQTAVEHLGRLQALGVRAFRLEFLNETPELVLETVAKYRQVLRGELSGTQLWRDLKLFNHVGVARGPMDQAE